MGDGCGGNKLGQYAHECAGIWIPVPPVYKGIGITSFLGLRQILLECIGLPGL